MLYRLEVGWERDMVQINVKFLLFWQSSSLMYQVTKDMREYRSTDVLEVSEWSGSV